MFDGAFVGTGAVMQTVETNGFLHQSLLSLIAAIPIGHWWIGDGSIESALHGIASDHSKVLGESNRGLAITWSFSEVVPELISDVRERSCKSSLHSHATDSGNRLKGTIVVLEIHAGSPVRRLVLDN